MNRRSNSILSELSTIVRDDALFQEFMSRITNRNFFTLLARVDNDLEYQFASCIRSFISAVCTSNVNQEPAFMKTLRTDLECNSDLHILVQEQDCFPSIDSLKRFPGFHKSAKYVNKSSTQTLRLACLLPLSTRDFTFISDGVVPLGSNGEIDGNFFALNKPPLVKIQTTEDCAFSFIIQSQRTCDALLLVQSTLSSQDGKQTTAWFRLSHDGNVKLVIALNGENEYHIHPFSSLEFVKHTITMGLLSDSRTCRILN